MIEVNGCPISKITVARFWDKVEVRGIDSCWEWTGSTWRYGDFKCNGKKLKAHRFSWMIKNGAIPENMCVLHTCDNPPCVNPAHLFLGTQVDNIADMDRKGRRRSLGKRGESNPMAKLTEDQVLCIRREWESGDKSQSRIAKEYSVSRGAITGIIYRTRWGWL